MAGDGVEVAKLEEKELKLCEDQVSHLALDIGGSLIKMVYFSSSSSCSTDDQENGFIREGTNTSSGNLEYRVLSGRLHFLKFETSKISECIEFISSKRLQHYGDQGDEAPAGDKHIVKATGGGAFKFSDLFKEKLGIILDKVDEMSSLVAGANFLLKVDGDNEFERVSGTSVGGGTFWGLGKLLTKCKSFDELLELSHQGNNRVIDMLVGDIYGGTGYSKIGLTSTTIASSFGKAVSQNKELEDYRTEDVARSLLRMISNNIGQIAYLNALRFGLKRIFFGGFFIRGHEYTMDTISVAVHFWSNGEAKALFLHHEGFLGALGAFMSYEKQGCTDIAHQFMEEHSSVAKSPFCTSDRLESSTHTDVKDNGCIECRVQVRN
ncbi:pantothenate kinase 1 isoform X2 [Sesamum indicum]|uniref:Pantothenate kinase 1 isoform X2 n=1 Tax=Sesamum indicum TaxID=4182 RepID=A0A8M8V5A6_SESIN|nr:pantothenate kinase 1 isoform X2 [Sesamum indicum]